MSIFQKYASVVDEVALDMQKQLVKSAIDKQAEKQNNLVKVAQLLSKASELLDETGLFNEAEVAVALLEVIAGKKKKKKAPKKELTSEQMEKNYKEKGWAFNEAKDKNSADDHNCAACGSPLKKDMNKADFPKIPEMLKSVKGDPGWQGDEIEQLRDEQADDYVKDYDDLFFNPNKTDDDFEDEWDLKLEPFSEELGLKLEPFENRMYGDEDEHRDDEVNVNRDPFFGYRRTRI